MTSPVVSVIIPTYNRVDLLPATIDSVMSQTFDNIEVIIVDDGSTDGTDDFIASLNAPCVRYYRQEWSGLPATARNTGLKNARGQYIAFVDSDDLWLPEKLQRQCGFLEKNKNSRWCFTHYDNYDHETGCTIPRPLQTPLTSGDYTPCDLLCGNIIGSPTPMVRRDLFDEVGLFNETMPIRFVEDWEMWLRLTAIEPAAFIPEPLALYRVHQGASTAEPDSREAALRCLAAMLAAIETNPSTYAHCYYKAVESVMPNMLKRLIVLGRNKDALEVCEKISTNPLRTPRLAILQALALLPSTIITPLLSLNRQVKNVLSERN